MILTEDVWNLHVVMPDDMSALLVMAVRQNPAMFAETKHIIATSPWVEEKIMPFVVNRRMDTHEVWTSPPSTRTDQGRLRWAIYRPHPQSAPVGCRHACDIWSQRTNASEHRDGDA